MASFLSREAVEREIEQAAHCAAPTTGSARQPYERLGSDDFERLLYALFERQRPNDDFDRVTLMITGADRGRDVWLTRAEKPAGLVQCKRTDGMTAPAAVREVIKYLLFAELDPKIAPRKDFRYTLAVSGDPTGNAVEFFDAPKMWFADNKTAIGGHLNAVIKAHRSFAKLDATALLPTVTAALEALEYKLLRPVDLDAMLHDAPGVVSRFFRVERVIDLDGAAKLFEHHLGAGGGPADRARSASPSKPTAGTAPVSRLQFCEEKGFADQSDEELGLFCAEFVAAHRRDPGATIVIEMVDDYGLAGELGALRQAASLDAEQRRHKLALESIDLRYRQTERALAEQLTFMLSSEEIGTIWFGGQDFEVQGQAVRSLGQSFQLWDARPRRTWALNAFPNPRQMEPAIKVMLDEDERAAFYAANEITHPRAQLSAHGGLSVYDLAYRLRVSRYVPALVHRIHGIARKRGISMSEVLAACEEPVHAWTIAGD